MKRELSLFIALLMVGVLFCLLYGFTRRDGRLVFDFKRLFDPTVIGPRAPIYFRQPKLALKMMFWALLSLLLFVAPLLSLVLISEAIQRMDGKSISVIVVIATCLLFVQVFIALKLFQLTKGWKVFAFFYSSLVTTIMLFSVLSGVTAEPILAILSVSFCLSYLPIMRALAFINAETESKK